MKNKTIYILIIICLASMLVPFMSSAINLALPLINADLSLNARMTSWIPTSYMLATAVFQIPCARLADMYGRRKIFILGVVVFTLFSVLCGFSPTGNWLIVWRVFTGIGSAMMFGTSTAILTSSIPKDKRGWALGITTSTVYIALAAGPLVGGVLATHFGWQSIFYAAAMVGGVVVIGAFVLIKEEWKDEVQRGFDYVGAFLYGFGLLSLIYGFSQLPNLLGIALIIVGVMTLIVFGKHQQTEESPVFNINLFLKNRIFRLSNISALINYASTFAIAFMLSLYLQYVRGLSPRDAGLILIVQSVVQSLVSLKSGRLSDKISASLLTTVGMGIIAIGLFMLCFVDHNTSYYYIIITLALTGIGFGTFSSPNANMIMSSVDEKNYSMASATMGTMRLTGQALSMAVAMMAIAITMGDKTLSPALSVELLASMRITFIICSVMCMFGVYISYTRTK